MAALTGAGVSYFHVVRDGESGTWYFGSGSDNWGGVVVESFQNYDFGIVSSLFLGGQFQSWDTAGQKALMFFTVYEGVSDVRSEGFGFNYHGEGDNANNDKWENMIGVDIATGLEAGKNYSVQVWFRAATDDGGTGAVYDSNGGANYTATFQMADAPIPEPATMSLLGLGALAMVIRRKLRK